MDHESTTSGNENEEALVRKGDVVLGITGSSVIGFTLTEWERAILAARACTPRGLVVLHVCDTRIDQSLLPEVSSQMAAAAITLLGSRDVIDSVQVAVSKCKQQQVPFTMPNTT